MSIRTLAAAAAAVALTAAVVGCTASASGTVAPSTGASPSSNSGSPAGNPQMTATVTVKNNKFIPETVTIKKGGTITWKNEDTYKHDATPTGTPAGFTAVQLDGSASGTATFAATGSFPYYCTIHPSMKASVTVVE